MKLNLSRKLFLGASLLVSIPLIISIFISKEKSESALEQTVTYGLTSSAEKLAILTDYVVETHLAVIRSISQSPYILRELDQFSGDPTAYNDEDRKDIQKTLFKKLKALDGGCKEIWLANDQGRIFVGATISGNMKANNNINIKDRVYYQNVLRTEKAQYSEALLSKSDNKAIMVFASPVFDGKGKLKGVLGLDITLDFLVDVIANQKVGDTGYACLINKEGTIVAHPDKTFILKKNYLESDDKNQIFHDMIAGKEGYGFYNEMGKERLAAYTPIKANGWSVFVSQEESEFKAASRSIQRVLITLFFFVVIIAVVITFFFTRGITLPIQQIVSGLKKTAVELHSGSSSIANSGQTLANNSSEQAASLEETAASLEEITSMTNRNSENASNADKLVDRSQKGFSVADDSIKQLSGAIEEIYNASEETRKIIKTIDEIAFQTNILALNAAVEAARAGDAGAGFAVVADEVRSLAHRSAEAAGRTATIIGETIDRVEHGQKLSSSTLESFEHVRSDSTELGGIVREIAAASKEQADGLSQINIALSHMDGAVQTNAASAEESASAAQELDAQAGGLMDFVAQLNMLIEGNEGQIEHPRHISSAHVSDHVEKGHTEIKPHKGGESGGFLSD